MKNFLRINFVVLILCLFCFPAFAQEEEESNAEIERDLVAAIGEVQKYSNYGSASDDEKLSEANEVFKEKLLRYTKIPATLDYKFDKLNELMRNAASEDGRFRVFSWDTEDGGTMHNFSKVYQYRGADGKVYSKTDGLTEGDAGSFVYDVFTLDTRSGKVYIVCTNFIGSTQDHYQSANLFKIEGGKISDQAKLIKTKSGLTNTLGFGYNFFSVVDRSERPIKLITFDPKTKTLKIPVVIADAEFPNGRVTDKFIAYKFNGANFVKTN